MTAVPATIVADFIIYHKTARYLVYIGMVLIIGGFLGFCVSEFMHNRRKAAHVTVSYATPQYDWLRCVFVHCLLSHRQHLMMTLYTSMMYQVMTMKTKVVHY